MDRVFLFNSQDLNQLDGVNIIRIDPGTPDRETLSNSLVLADGLSTTEQYIRKRIIELEGYVNGATTEQGQERYETLISKLQGVNKEIEFDWAGARRVYTGNVDMVVEEERIGSFKKFKIFFECSDPLGYSKTYYSHTENNITTATDNFAVTVYGNYFAKPIITLDIDSITDGDSGTIILVIGNSTMTISRDWIVNDILVIDTENGTVEVNNVAVTWSGVLPTLAVSSETIHYQDDFTARNVDIQVQHRARFV